MACGYWVEHMSRTREEAQKELEDTRITRELERFEEHVFGRKPVDNLWMNV